MSSALQVDSLPAEPLEKQIPYHLSHQGSSYSFTKVQKSCGFLVMIFAIQKSILGLLQFHDNLSYQMFPRAIKIAEVCVPILMLLLLFTH